MTYISIQTSQSSSKSTITDPAILARIVTSFTRTFLSTLFTKRPIDAGSILAAQARREAARRSVDNLL